MYQTYILQSQETGRYYIGHCESVEVRLMKHNLGQVRATKSGVPWNVIYLEQKATRSEAIRRELQIKSYKGGEAFKKLIQK